MDSWHKVSDVLPLEGIVVMTKIDDVHGVRNETELKWLGRLWYLPDGSMYVYYVPTHWRPVEPKCHASLSARSVSSSAGQRGCVYTPAEQGGCANGIFKCRWGCECGSRGSFFGKDGGSNGALRQTQGGNNRDLLHTHGRV